MELDRKRDRLWTPSREFFEKSNLYEYQSYLEDQHDLVFESYELLYQWSIDNYELFWETILSFFDISYAGEFDEICGGLMPETKWFEGIKLNYAEHFFKNKNDKPAIIFASENEEEIEIKWSELESKTASLAQWMKNQGIEPGDRVVSYLPNCPEATIAFIATVSLGAIWSSCSPDFGVSSVVDRFRQIEPKMFFAVSGYSYGGKYFNKLEAVNEIVSKIPSIVNTIDCTRLGTVKINKAVDFNALISDNVSLVFEKVPFDHPLWVLYSSGTTGIPKAIVHSHGGCLLEHYKYISLHNNIKSGERFFWYSTTGWMMWNYTQAALLVGATIVLYDGSPAYPSLDSLWSLIPKYKIQHFGTSAPYIIACMQKGLMISVKHDLSTLLTLSSTGSPLPPEAFEYVYSKAKKDVWLCSISGGTDLCTAFVGGIPGRDVIIDRIQGRALGADVQAWNIAGQSVIEELGELVICKPMPSMPIYFWKDKGGKRYRESYFSIYPNIWRHGDYIIIDTDGQLQIKGRSDATLNRSGVRIGTAEIYNALLDVPEVDDAVIVNIDKKDGSHYMPLFVLLRKGQLLGHELTLAIKAKLRQKCSPRHVPDEIVQVKGIPYTLSGKKMETPVKKILMGIKVGDSISKDAMRNPESIDFFVEFAKTKLV